MHHSVHHATMITMKGWRDGIHTAHTLSSSLSLFQMLCTAFQLIAQIKPFSNGSTVRYGQSCPYHCSCSCLVHLVLSCFDFGLQVCRGVKVLAFLPRASPFDVIHANCNSIFICVYHCNIYRVSVTAIVLTTCAISTLKLSANLKRKSHH